MSKKIEQDTASTEVPLYKVVTRSKARRQGRNISPEAMTLPQKIKKNKKRSFSQAPLSQRDFKKDTEDDKQKAKTVLNHKIEKTIDADDIPDYPPKLLSPKGFLKKSDHDLDLNNAEIQTNNKFKIEPIKIWYSLHDLYSILFLVFAFGVFDHLIKGRLSDYPLEITRFDQVTNVSNTTMNSTEELKAEYLNLRSEFLTINFMSLFLDYSIIVLITLIVGIFLGICYASRHYNKMFEAIKVESSQALKKEV